MLIHTLKYGLKFVQNNYVKIAETNSLNINKKYFQIYLIDLNKISKGNRIPTGKRWI